MIDAHRMGEGATPGTVGKNVPDLDNTIDPPPGGSAEVLIGPPLPRSATNDQPPRSAAWMIQEYENQCPLLSGYSRERLRQRAREREGLLRVQIELASVDVLELRGAIEKAAAGPERESAEAALQQGVAALRRGIVGVAETAAGDGVRAFGDELLLSQNQRLMPYRVWLRNYAARLAGELRETLSTSPVFQMMPLSAWRKDSMTQKAIQACEDMLADRKETEGPSDERRLANQNGNEPRTWPAIVQEWEAVKSIRKPVTGQYERIPEADFRALVAGKFGVNREDVTGEQIESAATELCRHYGLFQIIPATPRDVSSGGDTTRDPTPIPDAVFWKEREDEFRKRDRAPSDVVHATWHSLSGDWRFHDDSEAPSSAESVQLFKSLAREAAYGIGCERGSESWMDWLDLLRRAKDKDTGKTLYATNTIGSCTLSERELERMIRAGQPIPVGDLIEYLEKNDGTVERRRYWDTSTATIKNLFRTSANHCLIVRSLAPHPTRSAGEGTLTKDVRVSGGPGALQPSDTRRKRGRPQTITEDRKSAALKVKDAGGSNRDAAKELYNTKPPTPPP